MAESLYKSVTTLDKLLAKIYYPILIEIAKQNTVNTYSELVEKAKALHPEKDYVQKAIPTSAGRRLDVIRVFLTSHGYPDLASLIVSKAKGECGKTYTDNFDPEKERPRVYKFDWSTVSNDFYLFVADESLKKIPKNKASVQLKLAS